MYFIKILLLHLMFFVTDYHSIPIHRKNTGREHPCRCKKSVFYWI